MDCCVVRRVFILHCHVLGRPVVVMLFKGDWVVVFYNKELVAKSL